MDRILAPIEVDIYKLRDYACVEDVVIDTDCLPEGTLAVYITLPEELVPQICEEEGFNVEDWNE